MTNGSKIELLEKIRKNEAIIRELEENFKKLKEEVFEYKISDSYSVKAKDIDKTDNDRLFLLKILSDEKFRMKVAISLSKSRKELCEITGINERTLYRKLQSFDLQNEPYK